MVASSIPCKLSLCADRAHACAGDSYVSSAIDVACPTSQSVFAIASPHELHGDSWPSSPTGTSSFCCNHQYSVTAVTTSTGSIAERYAYTAYGQPTILDASASVLSSSAINNRYTYTGREWDQTLDLHHFRARWMSPSAGRFLSRDPIAYKGSPYCLYEAFDSRSLQETDPSGMGIRTWICKSLLRGSLYPCWEFARIFDEFDSDCQRDRDSDLVGFIDHYAGPFAGAYCGCIGALCPDSSLYKSQYADLCCILIKVRKAEIRFGEPDSEKFRRSIGLCLKAIIGNIVI